jgi:glycosyltransferase involved in cell wall biosynthesis
VPCYKVERKRHLLELCLRSLFRQTFKDLEVIVVDDGSPDNSVAVIEETVARLAGAGRWARVLKLSENAGVSEARNAGIRAANGEYVGFLDYDDLWIREFAESCIKLLAGNADLDVVLGGTILYRQCGRKAKARMIDIPENINTIEYGEFCAWHMINNFPVGMGSAVICRRNLFDRKPGLWMDQFLSKLSSEDVFFGFKMLALGVRPYYVRQPSIVVHKGFLGEPSRSKNARLSLDQKAIIDYGWENAGRYVYEIVKSRAPEYMTVVDDKIARLNDEFLLKRLYRSARHCFGVPLCIKRPVLWKTWVRYWLDRAEFVAIRGAIEYREWSRFQGGETDLDIARAVIKECADAAL